MSLPFQSHQNLLEKLEEFLRDVLDVSEGGRTLEVLDVELPDPSDEDLKSEKASKVAGVSYSKPVRVRARLTEGDEVVDESTVKVLDLPQITRRGSYIVEGTEYTFPLQKRLIPGVYTQEKDDGSVESWINTSRGVNWKVKLRNKGDLILKVRNRIINLFALLVGMGVDKGTLRRAWGEDVYKKQKQARGASDPKKALKKVYEIIRHESDPEAPKKDVPNLRRWIQNYFDERTELDEDNTSLTMGSGHSKVSTDLLFQAANKVLGVKRGDNEEDNRESLIHNDIFDQSDFVLERLNKRQYRGKIERTVRRNLGKYDRISQIIQKRLFQNPVESTFTQTDLARVPKQNNPLDLHSDFTEVTAMGEGGIRSRHAIRRDTRAVDPSHMNFLDPMHTPEGENLGTTLHLAKGVEKDGKDLKKAVWDVREKKTTKVTPRELYREPTAFAEFWDGDAQKLKPDDDGLIKVMHKGDIKRIPPENVVYAIRRSTDLFGVNSLSMPFLAHNNGTRGMMAAKMQSQAKSLVHREPPKVKSAVDEKSDQALEDIVGRHNIPTSPVDGVVATVSEDHILIEDASGEEHRVNFAKDFWLNSENFQDTEITVEEGEEVHEGQALGDTNYTRGGSLALGTNLRTAYVPYKGLNHEDGVVVSESAAEKLTSQHAYQKTIDIGEDEEADKQKFLSYFPSAYAHDELNHIGDDGIVEEGAKITQGDPIALKMRRVEEDTTSRKLKNISRLLSQDYRDTSVVWDKQAEGEVAEVHRRKGDVLVVLKTKESAKVGDKLVGRHANKATITAIKPDEEMPQDEDGEPLQLLLNPNGVISRMNTGQIMEVTASNIANEDGRPYLAKPFGKNHTEELQRELEERGLKDHQTIYDPEEDEEIDGVLVGDHYTLKLEHQVESKLSSRGAGPEYPYQLSGQPAGGKKGGGRAVGIQELYALLAHGAKENLSEMYTFKGDRSMEHWRAVENGTVLPPPEMPHSSKKFVTMLRGMGINLEEDEHGGAKMAPFLDDHIDQISNGEIEDATALRAKDLKEEEGGLFDYETTGGLEGQQWAHIGLADPMPHPTFEQAIRDVTGLKQKELEGVVSGEKGIIGDTVVDDPDKPGAKTGGGAIKEMLAGIDIDQRLEEIEKEAPEKSGSALNKLHRQGRVLKNFKELGIGLDSMVVSKIPVIPPKFRPIIDLPSGDISVADVNEHYRSVIMLNNQLKQMKGKDGLKDQQNKLRKSLYNGFKGTMGYSMGVLPNKETKGLARTVAGKSPKRGFFQSKMLKRRQETSGTAVVGPDPEMSMDEIGIPENMAWDTFKPYIKKDLQRQGLTPLKAEDEIDNQTDMATDALHRVMDEKHVLANRAPTLHKFSIMSFKPKLIPGHQVKLPIEVLGGFGADFDGDCIFDRITIIKEDSSIHTIHIKDFPKGQKLKEKGNVEVYDVGDVSVFGYDTDTHEVRPYPVDQFSVHHDLDMVEVEYKSGRTIEASTDHSLYCIDTSSMTLEKTEPCGSKGCYSPRPRSLDLPTPRDEVAWKDHHSGACRTDLVAACPLNAQSGYFWGAMVGDGYASKKGRSQNGWIIGFCNIRKPIIDRVQSFITYCGGRGGSYHESVHDYDGGEYESGKTHWPFGRLGYQVYHAVGARSGEKHLPPFWIYGDEDFRLALLTGLLDTDGSVSVSNGKSKPQPMVSYSTSSEDLADEVVLLCASFGVRANITHYDNRDKDEYVVTISTPDLQPYADRIDLSHPSKRDAMAFLANHDHVTKYNDRDPVPIGRELAKQMRASMGHPSDCSKEHHTAYGQLSRAIEKGYINRSAYRSWVERDLLDRMSGVDDQELFERFVRIAEADNILWDRVVSVEDAGSGRTAYDMTVPDCQVFMAANGIIVWDTFGIHVPATEEANQEAEKMLPSNNLYLPGREGGRMSQGLRHEYILGLHKLTRPQGQSAEKFTTPGEAIEAAEAGEIEWTDRVRVSGVGDTTPGRIKVMEPVPEEAKNYDLTINDDNAHDFLQSIEEDHTKQDYLNTLEHWKDVGRKYAYTSGSSFLLSDLQTLDHARDKLYDQADRSVMDILKDYRADDAQKKEDIVNTYADVDETLLESSKSLGENAAGKSNNISDMVQAGARGNPNQVKQLVAALGLMLDHRQKTMTEPVRGNYAEGLDSGEYWQHMYAQRKGMIDKSQSVSGPGYLAKELTNTAAGYTVTTEDCGTNQGRREKVDRHLKNRVLAEPVANVSPGTVIDDDALTKLQRSNRDEVKVRSILTCEATNGVCAKCFGHDETGDFPSLGKHIGLSEIQALTERSTQLPMKSFHCIHRGGVVFVKTPEGDVLAPTHEELFHMVGHPPASSGDGWEEKYPEGWEVWDSGGWVRLKKIGRHHKNRPMVAIRSKSGQVFVCQDNHPMVVTPVDVSCPKCSGGRATVEGSQTDDSYLVRCASCSHRWSVGKSAWQAAKPIIRPAGEVSVEDVLEVDISPLVEAERGGWEGDLTPYLLGMFLAEGSISQRMEDLPAEGSVVRRGQTKQGGRNITCAVVHQNEGDIRDRILGEADKSGIMVSDQGDIRINDADLARKMTSRFGRLQKSRRLPPDFLVQATHAQLAEALCGLLDGDGTFVEDGPRNSSHYIFYSTSHALIQQAHLICQTLEIHTSVSLAPIRDGDYQGFSLRVYPTKGDAELFEKSEKSGEFTFSREVEVPPNYNTGVASVDNFYDENEHWVYDLTTSSGTFTGGGIWNHNTGGVATAETGVSTAFDRAKDILEMPKNLDDKAVLAKTSGTVQQIQDSGFGGKVVIINGQRHEVPEDRKLEVKEGDRVSEGDKLSGGVVKPQELLEHRGIEAVQEQMRNDLHATFTSAGVNLHKKNHEMAVKMLTEKVRVIDPGDCDDYVPGDYAQLPKVKAWNKENPNKRQIRYQHTLPGAGQAPHKGDDWAQRMSLGRIRRTAQEGAAMGYTTQGDLDEGKPFGEIALGPDTDIPKPGEEAS